jgi:hypothetical protein
MGRLTKFPSYLFSLVVLVAGNGQTVPSHSFKLIISTPQASVRSGDEIRIKITLTNTSKSDLLVPKSINNDEAGFHYDVEVRDEKGNVVPKKEVNLGLKDLGNGRSEALIPIETMVVVTVKPGESLVEEMVVTGRFEKFLPGKYTIRVFM